MGVEGLNPRGIREGELKDKLLMERERIDRRVKKCKVDQLVVSEEEVDKLEKCQLQGVQDRRDKSSKSTGVDSVPLGTQLQGVVELSLRDQILELEEKIWVGTLGNLKVKNRDKWTHAIGAKKYDMGVDSLVWGEGDKVEKDALLDIETVSDTPDAEAGKRDSGASTASNSEMRGMVRQMAAAILQVGQMITDREKYLKEPLGEDEKEKKKRLKKEEEEKKRKELEGDVEEEEEEVEDMDVEVKVVMNSYKRWEKSLMSSVNFGQLFIHLTTLDNSIVWSKSIMNTKCKVCRRKADSDNMLLCYSCDNGHHLYCLKPKLKTIPSGDWFCPECKPKERVRSPKKKVRKSFSYKEDGATEDDEDQDETPKRKGKSRKKVIESDDEPEEEEPLPKKRGKGKKKVVESEEEEEEEELPKKRGGKKNAEASKK